MGEACACTGVAWLWQVLIIHAREKDVGALRPASRVSNLVDHQDEESRQRFKKQAYVYVIPVY